MTDQVVHSDQDGQVAGSLDNVFGTMFKSLGSLAEGLSTTQTASILNVIETDTQAGNADKIDYILVSPTVFARLLEEGTVNVFYLQHAIEEPGFLAVLYNVQFGENMYTLKVGSSEKVVELTGYNGFATMTSDNKVV